MKRIRIEVKGVVQGVGFRPFVYNLAKNLHLTGFVTNTAKGVTIEVEGQRTDDFFNSLKNEHPPLAKIYSIEKIEIPLNGDKDFQIIESIDEAGFTHISEDVSICDDCLRELFTPNDRRYLYPFINCTNCGPRYTITYKIPYDRPNTTMSVFQMCPECLKEYQDPSNRRFHAQPNACPVCGPQVKLFIKEGDSLVEIQNPIPQAIEMIKQGKILAIRGLGGFHLCCDAKNEKALNELRKRKRRSNKPFALMSPSLKEIEKFCFVSEAEKEIIQSKERPILLLRKKPDCELPEGVSPKNPYIGFMLPYTPLHYLLFYYPTDYKTENYQSKRLTSHFEALVMTSGNISEEPIITKNEETFEKLKNVADAFLVHNREIFMRVDDSVVKEFEGNIYFIRRARGFVPKAIPLKEELPEVIGFGADLKNTFTLTKSNYAITSQHIGDMENLETLNFFEEVLQNLKSVYRVKPIAIGHDLHPGYYSTNLALNYAEKYNLPRFPIQHHYSHIASVMAEHGLEELFGVAFDGTGYGIDGKIWGSEFLHCNIENFKRLAHMDYIPLPGGEGAIKEIWRIALSLFDETFGEEYELIRKLHFAEMVDENKIKQILKIKKINQFSPLSCGIGRLFDGISSIIGVCHFNTFEAEAAIALENLIPSNAEFSSKNSYNMVIKQDDNELLIDYRPLVREIVEDYLSEKSISEIAWKFHNSIVKIIFCTMKAIQEKYGVKEVGLSGGVFQNTYILRETTKILKKEGFIPLIHQNSPCNDACISLGQAYLVGKRMKV
ncbi:carbamoyltransferase HypF [Thermodesulfovibrio hydrogeniphilus]